MPAVHTSAGVIEPRQTILALQGDGALGANQAGVFEALVEAGRQPDWVVGTAICAINAAPIAGNPPELRLALFRGFREPITGCKGDANAAGGDRQDSTNSDKSEQELHRLRHAINLLSHELAKRPGETPNGKLACLGCGNAFHLMHVQLARLAREDQTKDIEFDPNGLSNAGLQQLATPAIPCKLNRGVFKSILSGYRRASTLFKLDPTTPKHNDPKAEKDIG